MPHPDSPIARLRQDPYDVVLANSILGTADPEAIHRTVGDFCAERMGSRVAQVTFCTLSVGAAIGVWLQDGREVLIKAWNAAADPTTLDAIHRVQHALAANGLPAPRVLARRRNGRCNEYGAAGLCGRCHSESNTSLRLTQRG